MIGVVIDTGVVVSAAFRDRAPVEIILFVVEQPDFEWVVSSEILTEYNAVLARKKFDLPADVVDDWRRVFDQFTILREPDIEIDFPRDQKDAKFLACALASEADYLITGDRDFDEATKLASTTIISVSHFKRLVLQRWIEE